MNFAAGTLPSAKHPFRTQLGSPAFRKQLSAATRPPSRRSFARPPQAVAAPVAPAITRSAEDAGETRYLDWRAEHVTKHFPTALGVDDAMQRLERFLHQHGFNNANTIACVNLCRDEVTQAFKHKIDQVFGSSFSTHGLGGILTCGVIGIGAGLSHSPVCEVTGKERYVFFSFPHIGIDSKGVVGNISRPGRPGMSCACGAVIKSLADMKKDGLSCICKPPGVHNPEDIELSILKQRLARRLTAEGHTDESVKDLDLVQLTKVTERIISEDLETLISHAVDTSKADYAVVTGIQVHNWADVFDSEEPNLEFVAPTGCYAVVDGKRFDIDLTKMPTLTPRQIRLLASAPDAHYPSPAKEAEILCKRPGSSTIREIDPPYMYSSRQARRKRSQRLTSFVKLTPAEQKVLEGGSGWSLADYDVDYWTAIHIW